MANLQNPSVGLNAETGGTITGWDHVLQSLQDIFTTRFGSRIMREYYGSFVPALLGVNINAEETTRFLAAIASAIQQWEPRFALTQLYFNDATRGGAVSLVIEGEYRPRATYGDLTVEGGARRIGLQYGSDAGQWVISRGAT